MTTTTEPRASFTDRSEWIRQVHPRVHQCEIRAKSLVDSMTCSICDHPSMALRTVVRNVAVNSEDLPRLRTAILKYATEKDLVATLEEVDSGMSDPTDPPIRHCQMYELKCLKPPTDANSAFNDLQNHANDIIAQLAAELAPQTSAYVKADIMFTCSGPDYIGRLRPCLQVAAAAKNLTVTCTSRVDNGRGHCHVPVCHVEVCMNTPAPRDEDIDGCVKDWITSAQLELAQQSSQLAWITTRVSVDRRYVSKYREYLRAGAEAHGLVAAMVYKSGCGNECDVKIAHKIDA